MSCKNYLLSCLAVAGLSLFSSRQTASAFVNVAVTPTNQVVFVGSNAVFTAQATPTAGEVITGYTWLTSTNGLSPFTTLTNAITATSTLTNVQLTNTGYYFARVTYSSGSTNGLVSVSAAVTLIVPDQARIISQTTNMNLPVGTNASFTVTAAGSAPLGYQWRRNGVNLSDAGRISGSSSTNLVIANLVTTDTASYTVIVSNTYTAVTSQIALLSVYYPPVITVQPPNTSVIVSSNVSISMTVTGSAPFTYQWRYAGTNLTNGGRISGATTNKLVIAGTITNDTGLYSVFVSNLVGNVTSSNALLTVLVPPTIISPTNALGQQGYLFSFTNAAAGTMPITFGVDGLPSGLTNDPTTGIISGVPAVFGDFYLAVYATNAATVTTGQVVLTLISDVPGITSALLVTGKQGQPFNYAIIASNTPTSFSAGTLPTGLNFDPFTGVISGVPIVSGSYAVIIGATNQYGGDSQLLTISLSSSIPHFTGALTKTGTENVSGFSYTIHATDSPTVYGATGLPLGLTINTNTGIISGTPLYGGSFIIPITAVNPWGTGKTNLTFNISYAPLAGLVITDVITNWSSPYLLDFTFSLRDSTNASSANSIVRTPSQLQVLCLEQATNPIPSEAPFIFQSATKKQLKMFIALDYTYSMFAVSGAIDAMQEAAKLLIDSEPQHSLFGIIEFNADYMNPQFVTNALTTTNNYFIADKTVLGQSIDTIEDTYVQGNYAGTRCFDAIYAALQQFGTNNSPDEQRYVVVMSDGNDDSSLLNTNASPLDVLVNLAVTNNVRIFCVAFGQNINTAALQYLTANTFGHYYVAATTADLGLQFTKIAKDIDGRYSLRWATLRRAATPFQPAFMVTLSGLTAAWNTNLVYTNVDIFDTTTNPPVVTNSYITNVIQVPYYPGNYTGDVRVGSLRLVPDAALGPQTIRLRASYVPRSVRQIQVKYRPNFPCTPLLASNGTNDILYGWSLAETADSNGLRTLTITSPNPTNLLASIPYAAFGDLISFQFAYPDSLTATQAFSVFTNDNTIYTNFLPAGQSFVLQNGTNFVTVYPPAPPHGTPIPWLIAHGYTNNFAAAELVDGNGNGLPVWQDYLAGLNPTDPNSKFSVEQFIVPGQAPQIIFGTVTGRTYRVDTATVLGEWSVLLDNITGIGGDILFTDYRDLSSVGSVYYRVSVY